MTWWLQARRLLVNQVVYFSAHVLALFFGAVSHIVYFSYKGFSVLCTLHCCTCFPNEENNALYGFHWLYLSLSGRFPQAIQIGKSWVFNMHDDLSQLGLGQDVLITWSQHLTVWALDLLIMRSACGTSFTSCCAYERVGVCITDPFLVRHGIIYCVCKKNRKVKDLFSIS